MNNEIKTMKETLKEAYVKAVLSGEESAYAVRDDILNLTTDVITECFGKSFNKEESEAAKSAFTSILENQKNQKFFESAKEDLSEALIIIRNMRCKTAETILPSIQKHFSVVDTVEHRHLVRYGNIVFRIGCYRDIDGIHFYLDADDTIPVYDAVGKYIGVLSAEDIDGVYKSVKVSDRAETHYSDFPGLAEAVSKVTGVDPERIQVKEINMQELFKRILGDASDFS